MFAKWFGLLIAISVIFIAAITMAKDPPIEPKKPEDAPRAFDLATLREMDKPVKVNGVTLTIEARQLLSDRSDRIYVRWLLHYSGKRWPFVILEPTLTRNTVEQTHLFIYATGKGGETYAMEHYSPSGEPLDATGESTRSKPDWFVKVNRSAAAGSFEIPTSDVKRFFSKKLPQEFPDNMRPRIHVRLYHYPTDRGEKFNLDAWTGRLDSNVVEIELKEW
jgi:hypothetical protein